MSPEMPEEGATFRIDTLSSFFRRSVHSRRHTWSYPFVIPGKEKFKSRLRFSCDKYGELMVSLCVSHFDSECHSNKVSVSFNSFGSIQNTSYGDYFQLWSITTPVKMMSVGSTIEFPIDLRLNVRSNDQCTQVTIDRLKTTGFVRHDQLLLKWKVDVASLENDLSFDKR